MFEAQSLEEQNKTLRLILEKVVEECRYTAPEILLWKLETKWLAYYEAWKVNNPDTTSS